MLQGFEFISIYNFLPNRSQWKRDPVTHMALAYQLEGSADHEYQGQLLTVKKDSLVFVHCDDSYAVKLNVPGRCIAIHFTVTSPIDIRFSVFDCANQPQIKKEFLRILSAWNRHDEISEYDCLSSFYKLWAQLLSFSKDRHPGTAVHNAAMDAARNYLAEHFHDPQISIADAALAAGISERWFCTRFQKVYQMTPIKYLTSLRITAALDMLKTKNYTISEIAISVGYSSANYFIRVFRGEIGMTPAAYRKNLR